MMMAKARPWASERMKLIQEVKARVEYQTPARIQRTVLR